MGMMNPLILAALQRAAMGPPAEEDLPAPDPRARRANAPPPDPAYRAQLVSALLAAAGPELAAPAARPVADAAGLDSQHFLALQGMMDRRYDQAQAQERYNRELAQRETLARAAAQQRALAARTKLAEMDQRSQTAKDLREYRDRLLDLREREIQARIDKATAPKAYSPKGMTPGQSYIDENGNWAYVPSNPVYERLRLAKGSKGGGGKGGGDDTPDVSPAQVTARMSQLDRLFAQARRDLDALVSPAEKRDYIANYNRRLVARAEQYGVDPEPWMITPLTDDDGADEGDGWGLATPFYWGWKALQGVLNRGGSPEPAPDKPLHEAEGLERIITRELREPAPKAKGTAAAAEKEPELPPAGAVIYDFDPATGMVTKRTR